MPPFLFYLDGIPAFFQGEFPTTRRMLPPLLGGEGRGEDGRLIQIPSPVGREKVVEDRMRVLICLTLALT